jgi:hypothetical protein
MFRRVREGVVRHFVGCETGYWCCAEIAADAPRFKWGSSMSGDGCPVDLRTETYLFISTYSSWSCCIAVSYTRLLYANRVFITLFFCLAYRMGKRGGSSRLGNNDRHRCIDFSNLATQPAHLVSQPHHILSLQPCNFHHVIRKFNPRFQGGCSTFLFISSLAVPLS